MEYSHEDSKTLGKDPNLSYGILIQNLSEKLKTDAIKSLDESIGILPSSVVCISLSKLGVNVVFDKYEPFYKAVTARRLLVRGKMFPMYPMLTDLTVVGAAPNFTQNAIKSLMAKIAPVWSVYAEVDAKTGPTKNYRVILQHPEIPDDIKLRPLFNCNMIGNNTSYPIAFFCRLCRKNGHTRHQCNVTEQRSNEKHLELIEEKRKLEEERRKLEERQKLEEEKRKLDEERRKLEERLKLEKERRKLEERRKLVEVVNRKLEEEQKLEEERKLEEEKRKFEEGRKLEERRKLEEEKRKLEKEKRKLEEERRKLGERLKLEEERRKLEEEKRKLEEDGRKLEERLKLEEERRKFEEGRKLEERRKLVEVTKRKFAEAIIRKLEERRKLEEKRKLEEERRKAQEIIKIKKETNCPNRPKTSKVVKSRLHNNLWSKVIRESSAKCKEVIFSKLIPPELRNYEKYLKDFFFNVRKEDSSKLLHDKATQYPYGINVLLEHLSEVFSFNLRNMPSKNPPERILIFWIDSLNAKIKEEHLKNIERVRKSIKVDTDRCYAEKVVHAEITKDKPTNTITNVNQQIEDLVKDGAEKCFEGKGVLPDRLKESDQKRQKYNLNPKVSSDRTGEYCALYPEVKAEVKNITKSKDFSSTTTTPKPRTKKQIAAKKSPEEFSPGLLAAIRCSKGVLKSSELRAFLEHVRGKVHARKMAKNYTLNVQGLIEQLQVIIWKHYNQALKVSSAANREIKWISELIERLKGHANCESCNA